MSPPALMTASVGVQVSWYWEGDQVAPLAISAWPWTGALPLASETPSSANQVAKGLAATLGGGAGEAGLKIEEESLAGLDAGVREGIGQGCVCSGR